MYVAIASLYLRGYVLNMYIYTEYS